MCSWFYIVFYLTIVIFCYNSHSTYENIEIQTSLSNIAVILLSEYTTHSNYFSQNNLKKWNFPEGNICLSKIRAVLEQPSKLK